MWKWDLNSTNLTNLQLDKKSSSLSKNQCVWEASQAYTVIGSTNIALLTNPPYFTGQLIQVQMHCALLHFKNKMHRSATKMLFAMMATPLQSDMKADSKFL
jgi:hypothetical protein